MFLSVSGYNSELSVANHSSRPTVSQPKYVTDTISNWFENHQPQKTRISTVIYAPFIQNANQMASRLTATTSFPTAFFQLLQFSRQHPSFSAHKAAQRTKNWLDFSSIFKIFTEFRSSFLFRCKFYSTRSDARVRFDIGVIFLNQSTSVTTHSTTPRVPLFCSYHILTSSVIYYWTDARQHGIYLLNRNTKYMFSISLRKHRNKEKEKSLSNLIIKM